MSQRNFETPPADPKEWFQYVCQHAFSFLEDEFGFRKDPPRLFEPGFQSPYMAFYRSHHLAVVVEGLSHGAKTRICLIDREGNLLDLTGMVRLRDTDMLNVCCLAKGQARQIPVFAEALRKCAADVLAGDLNVISRVDEFRSGFSFSLFDSQSEYDDFLKCHGQWRDPEDVIQTAPAPESSERVGYMSTSQAPPSVPSKYRVENVGTADVKAAKQNTDSLAQNETVVKEGTFVYDGKIECALRIVHSPVRYGSGDYEDPPEIYNDLEQDTFYIQYGSVNQRGVFNAGGGGYPSLAEAMAGAQSAPGIGSTVRWR